MKKEIILVIVLIILMFGLTFLTKNRRITEEGLKIIEIGGIALNIEVADTDTERARGLSGRESLGENEGLLFVFEKEGYYGIWMKDMNFSIDIAWLDKDKKITYIENNVSPKTYPKIFSAHKSEVPILNMYVLETKANFFEDSKIKIGDFVKF